MNQDVILVKPTTYMNRSGAVIPYLEKLISDETRLIIICDNMDLPPGQVKLKRKSSSAGQKGLKSIQSMLGDHDLNMFTLFIGIGRPVKGDSVVQHVLGMASFEDRQKIEMSINQSVSILIENIDTNFEGAMNELNRRRALVENPE